MNKQKKEKLEKEAREEAKRKANQEENIKCPVGDCAYILKRRGLTSDKTVRFLIKKSILIIKNINGLIITIFSPGQVDCYLITLKRNTRRSLILMITNRRMKLKLAAGVG